MKEQSEIYSVLSGAEYDSLEGSYREADFDIEPNSQGSIFTAQNDDRFLLKIELTETLVSVYKDIKHFN